MQKLFLIWQVLKIPGDVQGRSFVRVLKEKQKGIFRDAFYYHYYETTTHHIAKHTGVRTEQYKLIYFYEKGEWELFDLKKNKSEMNNVYTNPAYSKIQRMLKKRLEELKEEFKDPEPAVID